MELISKHLSLELIDYLLEVTISQIPNSLSIPFLFFPYLSFFAEPKNSNENGQQPLGGQNQAGNSFPVTTHPSSKKFNEKLSLSLKIFGITKNGPQKWIPR